MDGQMDEWTALQEYSIKSLYSIMDAKVC